MRSRDIFSHARGTRLIRIRTSFLNHSEALSFHYLIIALEPFPEGTIPILRHIHHVEHVQRHLPSPDCELPPRETTWFRRIRCVRDNGPMLVY